MVSQEQVGKAIIRLRKLRGLSQEKFALESGIDRKYISDVENGKRNISFELLTRVANFFGISLSYFIEEAEQSVSFKNVEELREYLLERGNEETAFFTNPDFIDAIVGISDDGRLVYSYSKMVESLMLSENMSHEDAVEFIEYNTVRAVPYMGEHAPIIIYQILD
jgi:transcriptional regulator with XRE-family HTH domain